jgi:ankyrin repeat protein/acyl-CoA-binding protein
MEGSDVVSEVSLIGSSGSTGHNSDKDSDIARKNDTGDHKTAPQTKRGNLDDVIDRRWGERANAMTAVNYLSMFDALRILRVCLQVRKKLRSGWRNDDAVLDQYFVACENNWKVYTGPRTHKNTISLQALYRQATMGDVPESAQFLMDEERYVAWKRLRGTPLSMAKRRFITYLAEISPSLIDVMPDEKPPDGFPLDRHGHLICAKCNTGVGCARPLLDDHNTDLRQQLFEREELHEAEALKAWVRNAMKAQRCIWGLHMPITKAQSREFIHWFEKPDNKGFHAYDSSTLMQIIRELIVYHFEVAYDMMQNRTEYSVEDYNDQATRALKLREVYMQLSGEEFVFEVPCQRNTHMCNEQRKADGGKNHVHPVEIDPPSRMDVASFKEAIELRTQCQQLGLSAITGVCTDIEKRCQIYRDRLAEHFKALEVAAAARKRNEKRTEIHLEEKRKVVELSINMVVRQLWDAFHTNRPDRVMILIKRGGDPNEESPRGLTPLLCLILCESAVETVEELVHMKADINKVNKFGVTPLMMACKLKLTKIVHMLMRLGASVMQTGGKIGKRFTALHWCAIHGSEDEAKIMVDHIRDSAGDALRITRFLDAPNDDGDTALMLAAVTRNGVLSRLLVSLGAATGARNRQGRTAAYIGRHAGWTELADWLDTKLGSGVARIESFSDINYDKKIRYGTIKLRDLLLEFGKNYLGLIQRSRTGKHPLMPPSIIQQYISEQGSNQSTLIDQYLKFVNRHMLLVNEKDEHNRDHLREENNPAVALYKTVKSSLNDMLELLSKGLCAPNYDCSTNPISVTPLICATLLNDVRCIKLFVREGADVDGPNRFGTTPLMIAAQLNNIEACMELLFHGASLSKQDHYGFTPLAYANSLPTPSAMKRNCVGVLMDDDVEGVKPFTAADILKTAAEGASSGGPKGNGGTIADLRAMVELNAAQSHPDTVAVHHRVLRLLEEYGLSRIETANHVAIATYTTQWRLKADAETALNSARESEDSDAQDGSSLPDTKEADEDGSEDYFLRCPMCTLMLPCAHFFKGAVLRRYFKRLKEQEEATAQGLTGGSLDATNTKQRKKSPLRLQGLKTRDKSKEVLEETGLADRGTDRSQTLAMKYRARELHIIRESESKETERLEAEQRAKLRAYAIAKGIWTEWKEYYNQNGELVFEHQDTGEIWTRFFDRAGNAYFYNAVTNESKWIAPNVRPAKGLVPVSLLSPASSSTKGKPPVNTVNQSLNTNDLSVSSPLVGGSHSGVTDLIIPDSRPSTANNTKLETSSSPGYYEPAGSVLLIANSPQIVAEAATSSLSSRADLVENSDVLAPAAAIVARNIFTPDTSGVGPTLTASLGALSAPKSILKTESLTGHRRHRKSVHFILPDEMTDVLPPASFEDLATEPFSKPSTPAAMITIKAPILDIPRSKLKPSMTPIEALMMEDDADDYKAKGTSSEPVDDDPLPPSSLAASTDPSVVSLTAKTSPPMASPVPLLPPRSPTRKEDLVGENPVPISSRRILLFTTDITDYGGEWDGLSRSHHFADSPIVHTLPKPNLTRDQAEQSIADKSGALETFDDPGEAFQALHLPPVCLSGWLFVGLSVSKPGPAPIETMQISLNLWGKLLDHLRTKFTEEWLPRMKLEPAVDLTRAEPRAAPRCVVCCTGFRRLLAEGMGDDDESRSRAVECSLCLQCLVRREMFDMIKPTLPASYRRNNPMTWPFDERAIKKLDASAFTKREYLKPSAGSSGKGLSGKGLSGKGVSGKGSVAANTAASTANLSGKFNYSSLVNSPSNSGKGTLEAMLEASVASAASSGKRTPSTPSASRDAESPRKDGAPCSQTDGLPGSPRRQQSTDNASSDSSASAPQTRSSSGLSPRKTWRKKTEAESAGSGSGDLGVTDRKIVDPDAGSVRWDGAVDWFRKFELLQDSGDTQFALGRGAGVRDLPLLPYLVAKGHTEDLERTIRSCYNQAGEEDSLQILPRLLCMQAEACKLMGLWPLALALLLDRADMLATLTGYENIAARNAVCQVSSCLRKMGYNHLAMSYLRSIVRRLEVKYTSLLGTSDNAHEWRELGKDILTADE